MVRKLQFYLIVFISLIIFSCNKEEVYPVIDEQIIKSGKPIRSIHFVDSTNGFIAGGIRGEEGYIYKTSDGGENWDPIYSSNWNINDILFLDNVQGFACGDSLKIIRTTDFGESWEHVELSWYPNPEYILPLKCITVANDTTWYITGGDNYQYGINLRTRNGGLWWDLEVYQIELNASYFKNEKFGLLAGYGAIYITQDAGETYYPSDFSGDHITSLSFHSEEMGLACGYNGGIYRTTNGGSNWITCLKPNGVIGKRNHFNAIASFNNTCIAVGNEGLMHYSADMGITWNPIVSNSNEDFLDIEYVNGVFMVSGRNGSLFKINP